MKIFGWAWVMVIVGAAPLWAVTLDPQTIDFGRIAQTNGECTAAFVITNDEPTTVILDTIRPTCTCLSIKDNPDGAVLAPGKTLTVTVILNPATVNPGVFQKYIFLHLLKSQTPTAALTVKGSVE